MTPRSIFSSSSRLETAGDPAGPLAQTDQPSPQDAASSNAAGELIGAEGNPLPEVFLADPEGLVEHPALARLPAVREGDAGFQEFLGQVQAAGLITDPIQVDEHGRLVDGRRRRLAARVLGLPLPAVRCCSEHAHTIIINSMVARRQFAKNIAAYFAWPDIKPMLDEARRRWIERLRTHNLSGGKHPISPSGEMAPQKGEERAKTPGQILALFGFDDHIQDEVENALKAFEPLPASFRARIEAEMFAGDKSLAKARVAAGGFLSTAGRNDHLVGRHDHVVQLERGFRSVLFNWREANAEQRTAARTALRKLATDCTPEVRADFRSAIMDIFKP